MPLQRCESEGSPSWKWGDAGKCYTYTAGDDASETEARRKAMAQAAAMGEFPETGTMEHRAEMKAKSINDLPDSAFAYIEPDGSKDEQGKTVPRSKRHFPIHDAAHVRNALARASQSPFGDKAMPKIRAAAKKFGVHMADERSQLLVDDDPLLAPVEFRAANVAGVNFAQRIIELVVVPYDEEAYVEWRSEMWRESFARGAFDGIEKRPGRVKANRDHDNTRLVGKAVRFWPSREEGLVSEVKVSDTPLGNETLALAHDDVLGASVGFAARGRDQILDRQAMTRLITRAYLDHIALTPDPAYLGAKVQAVRSPEARSADAAMAPLSTPNLDEFLADDVLRWASGRFQS